MTKPPKPPAERSETPREAIRALLREGRFTPHEISQQVGIPERDVAEHLSHLARSGRARGERLVVEPAHCASCGFVFERRERPSKPGSCPQCRGTRITPPRFSVE